MGRYFNESKILKSGFLLLGIILFFGIYTPAANAVSAGPDTFTTKSKVVLPSGSMADVAYGNSVYVAVGSYGSVIKSSDAVNWVNVKTKADSSYAGVTNPSGFSFNGVAFGNGLFVATGSEGVILTSTDGTTWTQRTSNVTVNVWNVEWLTLNGNDSFYATSLGKFVTSSDGITWTTVTPTGLSPSVWLSRITVGNNGTRLAVGDQSGNLYSTTNGTTWTTSRPTTAGGAQSTGTNMLMWLNDRYFISDPSANIWTSTDLSTFTIVGAPFNLNATFPQAANQMFNGLYDGSKYYLFGFQHPYGYGAVYTSTDGVSWTMQPYQKQFVTQNAAFVNGKYFQMGNEGLISSSNGSDWNYLWGGVYSEIIYDGTQYIAAGQEGSEGAIWTSTDLSSWDRVTLSSRLAPFKATAYGNGKYVAVGDTFQSITSLVTSNDGAAWTIQNSLSDSTALTDVAFGNGKFVAVGTTGVVGVLKTSVDGITWTSPTVPANQLDNIYSVSYTNNQFIALGYGYNSSSNIDALGIWTSVDGVTWVDHSSTYPNQTEILNNIIYDGSKYILMGSDSGSYYALSRTSDDLVTWSAPTELTGIYPAYSSTLLAQKGSNIYTVVYDELSNIAVYYSTNQGTTWQDAELGTDVFDAYELMEVNNEVIIAGNAKLVMTTVSAAASTISPTTGSFDKKTSAQGDVTTTLTLNSNTLSGIANGVTPLALGMDYTVSGTTVTISKEYLATQPVGTTSLTFTFSAGATQTLVITVSDTTPLNSVITPATGSFDKKTSAQGDVTTTLTLNSNTLSGIANGVTPLILNTDYTVSGTTVTISKDYLATQPVGTTSLTFTFSAGATQTLVITVSDTTPLNSVITPASGSFDKKTSAQADVTTTLTLNSNTLNGIANGVTLLILNTDYTVSGTTVTISKDFLATQPVGTTSLTFTFSAGATQTLVITVSDTTPLNSVITPATGSFDKKTTAQSDVTTTLTLNSNTLSGIANGVTPLALGTDYTVSGTTVTISKDFLATQPVGTTSLTFTFSAGATQTLVITVSDTTPLNSVITPASGSFDKKTSAQADVTTTLTLNSNTLSGIANGVTPLALGTDYTVSSTTVTISKDYLATQPVGTTSLTFTFSAGATQTLVITVSDTTPLNSVITPATGSFDKKTSAQADVTTTLTLNSNTLSGITNGVTPLALGTDYTVSGTTVTISKEYLATQPVGMTSLTFTFSAGAMQTLVITVSDTTPLNSVITPATGSFDKKTSAQADVTTTLTLNSNTLSGIANGVTPLALGTDYTVSSTAVTISKDYLATQPVGTTSLTFTFSAGATQTLVITVSDTTPLNSVITPATGSFDKKTSAQGDVTTTLTLNSNTLSGITNGVTPLALGTDYTVSGTTVTISKEYLATQPVGMTSLTFTFSAGATQTLVITVSDSTVVLPGVPLVQSAIAGNAQVSLTWSVVEGSSGYKIYQSLTSGTYGNEVGTVSGSVYSYDATGLINGTKYYFVVKATNLGGDSASSNEMSATPKTVPTAPTNINAIAGNGQVTLSFTPPTDNGGSLITGYAVIDSLGNILATGTNSPITITGLSNGVTYTFTVKAINSAGSSVASALSNAVTPVLPSTPTQPIQPSTPSTPNTATGVDILVNGKVENAGTATTVTVNQQSVTTVVIDQKKLEDKLAAEGQGAVITIPVNLQSDVVVGELTGEMVKNMEQKQAILEIKTASATYTLPAQQINIDSISEQIGRTVALQDIKIQIEIAAPTADVLKRVQESAAKGDFTEVMPPLEFTVRAIYGDTTIAVTKFNAYVERTVAIPDGVDPNRITTGIVVDPDGTVRHVPTKIVVIDGKYFAKLNSLTNSTYSIVWHPLEFKDVANHWAKEAVNNMGSRLVIDGVGNDMFNPNQDITRAEFAAIIVRGLGLKLENGATPFADVKAADWYSSAVQTAYSYNLITGFEDGSFRPTDKITREQAMVIIAKAMKITALKEKLPSEATGVLLNPYADAANASEWAKNSIADSLQAGIVSGRSATQLAPKAFITRAEVAAMIERLLQKSDLI